MQPGVDDSLPQSAKESVERVLLGLKDGKLEAVWQFLPRTCQRELVELIAEAVQNSDPEVWSEAVSFIRKLLHTSRLRKEFVLNSPWMLAPDSASFRTQLEAGWDDNLAALETIVASRWLDRETWRTQNSLQPFLVEVANPLIQRLGLPQAWSTLADMKVESLSVTDDRTVLRFSFSSQAAATQDVVFRFSDRRWIPQPLIDEWPEKIRETRQRIRQFTPERWNELRPQILAELKQGAAWLDQLEGAKTQAEFDARFTPGILQALATAKRWDGWMAELWGSGKPQRIEIRLHGRLTKPQQADLLQRLVALTDQPGRAAYTVITTDNGPQIFLSSVRDLKRFADSVKFGVVQSLDPEQHRIEIDVTKSFE